MFMKGDELLSIIQEVINAVHPENKYRAKWGDNVCNAVPISLSFSQLILILSYFPDKQPLIFEKVCLWQPSDSGCRGFLQRQ
jgi:hypothetical protein